MVVSVRVARNVGVGPVSLEVGVRVEVMDRERVWLCVRDTDGDWEGVVYVGEGLPEGLSDGVGVRRCVRLAAVRERESVADPEGEGLWAVVAEPVRVSLCVHDDAEGETVGSVRERLGERLWERDAVGDPPRVPVPVDVGGESDQETEMLTVVKVAVVDGLAEGKLGEGAPDGVSVPVPVGVCVKLRVVDGVGAVGLGLWGKVGEGGDRDRETVTMRVGVRVRVSDGVPLRVCA